MKKLKTGIVLLKVAIVIYLLLILVFVVKESAVFLYERKYPHYQNISSVTCDNIKEYPTLDNLQFSIDEISVIYENQQPVAKIEGWFLDNKRDQGQLTGLLLKSNIENNCYSVATSRKIREDVNNAMLSKGIAVVQDAMLGFEACFPIAVLKKNADYRIGLGIEYKDNFYIFWTNEKFITQTYK